MKTTTRGFIINHRIKSYKLIEDVFRSSNGSCILRPHKLLDSTFAPSRTACIMKFIQMFNMEFTWKQLQRFGAECIYVEKTIEFKEIQL
jgi:aspartate carbamoyltransferase regulatory subunit